MGGYIIMEGDKAMFQPYFGSAIVSVQPGKMKASGETKIKGKKVCIVGDEKKVEVKNCPYNAPPFMGGTGTLKIQKLGGTQEAKHTKSAGKKVITQGTGIAFFQAVFEVTNKAKKPPSAPGEPPTPDPMPKYMGLGSFKTKNKLFKAK